MNAMLEMEVFRSHFLRDAKTVGCLCGDIGGIVFKKNDRYGLPINVTICKACGHVYAKRQLPEKELTEFYRVGYRKLYSEGKESRKSEAFDVRVPAARKAGTMFNAFVEKFDSSCHGRTVIEWGCGGGWNLVPFADKGVLVCGFDYDEEFVQLGREKLGLDLRLIQTMDGTEGLAADFLILNHVIEHVIDPAALLAGLKQYLKPGGVLYVGLPLIEELGVYGWKQFFHVAHIHYFTVPRFNQVAGEAGYEVDTIGWGKGYITLSPSSSSMKSPGGGFFYAANLLVKRWFRYALVEPLPRHVLKKLPFLEARLKYIRDSFRKWRP